MGSPFLALPVPLSIYFLSSPLLGVARHERTHMQSTSTVLKFSCTFTRSAGNFISLSLYHRSRSFWLPRYYRVSDVVLPAFTCPSVSVMCRATSISFSSLGLVLGRSCRRCLFQA